MRQIQDAFKLSFQMSRPKWNRTKIFFASSETSPSYSVQRSQYVSSLRGLLTASMLSYTVYEPNKLFCYCVRDASKTGPKQGTYWMTLACDIDDWNVLNDVKVRCWWDVMSEMMQKHNCSSEKSNVTKLVYVLYAQFGTRSRWNIPIASTQVHNDERTMSFSHLRRYKLHQTAKVDDTEACVYTFILNEDRTMSTLLKRRQACCNATATTM